MNKLLLSPANYKEHNWGYTLSPHVSGAMDSTRARYVKWEILLRESRTSKRTMWETTVTMGTEILSILVGKITQTSRGGTIRIHWSSRHLLRKTRQATWRIYLGKWLSTQPSSWMRQKLHFKTNKHKSETWKRKLASLPWHKMRGYKAHCRATRRLILRSSVMPLS